MTFEEACEIVRGRAADVSMSDSDKRMMYVYYKVATSGPTPDVPRPPLYSPKARFWDAWKHHGERLTPEAAKSLYVERVARWSRA